MPTSEPPQTTPLLIDHTHLSTLRSYISYPTPNLTSLHAARIAASNLPPAEVARELLRIPAGPPRVQIITNLGAHLSTHALRKHILSNLHLLTEKNNLQTTPPPDHQAAIQQLVQTWTAFVPPGHPLSTVLNTLVLPESRQSQHVANTQSDASQSEHSDVKQLENNMTELINAISALHARLDDAVALCQGEARGHDGLSEVVVATWAEMRAKRLNLDQLRLRLVGIADQCHVQRERLELGEMITTLDSVTRRMHERRGKLIEMGFDMAPVSPRRDASDSDDNDEDDEEDWEDAVDVAVPAEESSPPGDRKEEDVGRASLPEVENWAKVMRGEEGREVNRMILQRFERQGGEDVVAIVDASTGVSRRGRGGSRRGDGSKRGRGAKRASTARQRLSAALGIKKKRKKSLLDD